MPKEQKVIRRYWSADDLEKLKSMAKAKVGAPQIAAALRRTPKAIILRAAQERVSLATR